MAERLPPEVAQQIDALTLDPARPLVITDADEVLVQFMVQFEKFLDDNGLLIRLDTFALTGNIRDKTTDEPLEGKHMPDLMSRFFAEHTAHMPAVPGASEALRRLSEHAQIVVLSNVPQLQRQDRIKGLRKHGMDYPLVANSGLKGPAVRAIMDRVEAPAVFLDDIPHNITSVAEHADEVHLIHFIADTRLRALIGQAPDSHHRADDWPSAEAYIRAHFDSQGGLDA